jgi:polar amino acid transport system ATP-binding protein/sulfate transport system ATP-binding protein/NitT/TauT family transport system ATP-binding protein
VQAGDMGVIFQNYYLFEWRSVYQSLLLAAKKNSLLKGKEKEMIGHYVAAFNLEDALQKYHSSYPVDSGSVQASSSSY